MKGPYTAKVWIGVEPWFTTKREPDLSLTWEKDSDALEAGDTIAYRFYQSGHGATVLGTLRAAVFYVGALLDRGESAYIQVTGQFVREGRKDYSTGYSATIERDSAGNLYTSLGSRFASRRRIVGRI